MRKPIIVEQRFNTSTETLWKAITEHQQMIQWYFENIPDFKPEVGFTTQFLIENEGRQFTHLWKIVEVIPNKKITYTWQYKEYEGESIAVFEILEHKHQSILRITCEGLETLPQDIPEFTRQSCQGGWDYFIKQRLKDYLVE
ncbi:SRPBCC family protein [Ichthyenterobacterium magnum]|uniref:Activator of Hsp90 ATPase-like protein n=1 Tax=Ichthyenterobacterium magnum TaxID=1230530 RepID=A0A420DW51_9FLAO|nr:SRPBCC domain-containing protein [Ichthyenterobacterium magnum]RKE98431.1 activator of Hsp90 ATPase-like protein [Ichthyenterobacterium magnum]